jgi:hypothetical protein
MDTNKLREQWEAVAEEMKNVSFTFKLDKTPIDTAKALDNLGEELIQLARVIREQYQ